MYSKFALYADTAWRFWYRIGLVGMANAKASSGSCSWLPTLAWLCIYLSAVLDAGISWRYRKVSKCIIFWCKIGKLLFKHYIFIPATFQGPIIQLETTVHGLLHAETNYSWYCVDTKTKDDAKQLQQVLATNGKPVTYTSLSCTISRCWRLNGNRLVAALQVNSACNVQNIDPVTQNYFPYTNAPYSISYSSHFSC